MGLAGLLALGAKLDRGMAGLSVLAALISCVAISTFRLGLKRYRTVSLIEPRA